jgi:hypothetical protein
MSMKPSGAKSQWQPTIPIDQSIYEDSTVQKAPLGTELSVGDRKFVYAHAAASQPRGVVLGAASPLGSLNGALALAAATAQDVQVITFTAATVVAANFLAEGYMGVSKGTMGGATYRIKSHSAFTSGQADAQLELYDPIYDDIAAANELGLVQNRFANLAISSSAQAVPVCMPMVDVASNAYFWGQVEGPAAALNAAATPAAAVLVPGTTGGVLAAATDNLAGNPFIGQNLNLAGTAGEYTPTYLNIPR